ncbi:MAG: restriction endonuclease subunit S, partial [Phascolarctobacterium sp.]
GDMKAALLQAAMQGKLTTQRKEDGDARELLKQIAKEKAKLIKEKKIKKEKSLPDITEDEIPFDVPDNWVWTRLGSLFEVNPKNIADDDVEAGFIPMALLDAGFGSNHNFEMRKWKIIKKGFTHFADGDLVLAKITPCFQNRKSAVIRNLPNGIGAGTTELHVLREHTGLLDMKYFLFICKSNYFIDNGVEAFTGTAGQQRVGTDYITSLLIPLPPLAEQHRIVAKLEKFLPLCDGLVEE